MRSGMASCLPCSRSNAFATVLTSDGRSPRERPRSMAMPRFILSALLTLGLAGPAWAADPDNLQVFKDVSKTVQRYSYFTIFDSVHVSVADGVVTLSGKVTMPYKASDIAKRVAKVDGVTQVVNQLEVLPVSQFDNRAARQNCPGDLFEPVAGELRPRAEPFDPHHRRPRPCHAGRRRDERHGSADCPLRRRIVQHLRDQERAED